MMRRARSWPSPPTRSSSSALALFRSMPFASPMALVMALLPFRPFAVLLLIGLGMVVDVALRVAVLAFFQRLTLRAAARLPGPMLTATVACLRRPLLAASAPGLL